MSEQKVSLLVSPHFDDAVFGVGYWLLQHPGTTVVTVCSGNPGSVPMQWWDTQCGFQSADEAARKRRIEDEKALSLLGAHQLGLGFLDNEYRIDGLGRYHESETDNPGDVSLAVATALRDLLETLRPDRCYFPLGSGHPDHRLTSDAAILALAGTDTAAIVYIELTYSIGTPEFPARRMSELETRGIRFDEYPLQPGTSELKQRAAACYTSQGIDTTGCFDPDAERFFRLTLPRGG